MSLYNAELSVARNKISFKAVQQFFNAVCDELAVPKKEKSDLELGIEEGFMQLLEIAGRQNSSENFKIKLSFDPSIINVTLLAPCRPFDHGSLPEYNPAMAADGGAEGLGSFLLFQMLDSVQWRYVEKVGMELNMSRLLPSEFELKGLSDSVEKASASIVPSGPICVRELESEKDAFAVSSCAYDVYKYAYKDVIYYPRELFERNKNGLMRSVIAIDDAGTVFGHYAAIKAKPDAKIAEMAAAFVRPECRKTHIFQQLCDLAHSGLEKLSLRGLFSLSVTNHIATQKYSERMGRRSVGIRLASSPAVFVEGARPDERVTSVLNYSQIAERPKKQLYLPERYFDMILKSYSWLDIKVEPEMFSRSHPLEESVTCYTDYSWKRSIIEARGGEAAAHKLKAYAELLLEQKISSIVLSIDLEDPGAPFLVEQAVQSGFFYSGIMPESLKDGHDALQMQFLNGIKINLNELNLYTQPAKEIMSYIQNEVPDIFLAGAQ